MEEKNLHQKMASGFIWMFLERILAQLVTFIVSIVIARILVPDDFGIVAIAQIFISLANVFSIQGLSASLIQKKDISEIDYSTAFVTNLFVATILYSIVFFASPYIASFYNQPLLTAIFRVLGVQLFLGSLNSIQRAFVSRHLEFKKFFWSTLFGTIASAFVGIIMALKGAGPWAIVFQHLTNVLIDSIILLIVIKWKPKLRFSFSSLKKMFGFSWKVFLAAFVNSIYAESRSLVVGKKYTSEDIAYFNKGKQFPQLFYSNIVSVTVSVIFPSFSKFNEDSIRTKEELSKVIKISFYMLAPIMIGLAVVSKPLVLVLLTEKWLPCVPFLIAYCIDFLLLSIQSLQEQIIKASGRGNTLLIVFVLEKSIGLSLLIGSMFISVEAIAVALVVSSFIAVIIHTAAVYRICNYSFLCLLRDCFEGFFLSLIMALIASHFSFLPMNNLSVLIIQTSAGALTYFLASLLIKSNSLNALSTFAYQKTKMSLFLRISSITAGKL